MRQITVTLSKDLRTRAQMDKVRCQIQDLGGRINCTCSAIGVLLGEICQEQLVNVKKIAGIVKVEDCKPRVSAKGKLSLDTNLRI